MFALISQGGESDAHEKKMLFTRRAPNDSFGGMWDFPGGRMNIGEQPYETAVREIAEEVGLNLQSGRLRTAVSERGLHGEWVTFLVYGFSYSGDPSAIRLDEDHTEYRWLSFDEARRTLEFASAAKKILDQLMIERHE